MNNSFFVCRILFLRTEKKKQSPQTELSMMGNSNTPKSVINFRKSIKGDFFTCGGKGGQKYIHGGNMPVVKGD